MFVRFPRGRGSRCPAYEPGVGCTVEASQRSISPFGPGAPIAERHSGQASRRVGIEEVRTVDQLRAMRNSDIPGRIPTFLPNMNSADQARVIERGALTDHHVLSWKSNSREG